MFGRRSKAEETPPAPVQADAQAPKGRPTPSRKQSEAARREARRIPMDPKAAKQAQRERAKKERAEARAGMESGDERYLPARDRGPVRAFIRDSIDSRRRMSEYFVFIAFGILLAGFARNPAVANSVSLIWFGATAVIAVEMTWTLVRLNAELKKRWPDRAERKGAMLYGGMRALQIRKLRVPKPQVNPSFRSKPDS